MKFYNKCWIGGGFISDAFYSRMLCNWFKNHPMLWIQGLSYAFYLHQNHLCSGRRNLYLHHELFYNNVVGSVVNGLGERDIVGAAVSAKKRFLVLLNYVVSSFVSITLRCNVLSNACWTQPMAYHAFAISSDPACNEDSGKHVAGTESSVLPNLLTTNYQQKVAPFPRHNPMPLPPQSSSSCAGQLQLHYRSNLWVPLQVADEIPVGARSWTA